MAAKAKQVDWVSLEVDYRAGLMTTTAIGKKYGISHTAVQKRAKAEGWTRDLSARIAAEREAKVARSMVSPKVAERKVATEKEVVAAVSDAQTLLLTEHRRDTSAARAIVNEMFAELGVLGDPVVQEGLRLLALGKAAEDGGAVAMSAMMKAVEAAVALPGRALVVQKLTAALGVLIEKERQAFGIDHRGEGPQSLGEFLESLK